MNNTKQSPTKHLYIHIPFCQRICSYCDFCRIKIDEDNKRIAAYLNLVITKLQEESLPKQYTSVYIGGGTPNFLKPALLEKLLSAIQSYIDFSTNYEFTIECNPELVNEQQVILFKKFKVNRISLGVQTLNEKILKTLNRHHTKRDVETAIYLFKKYNINNLSCDFIYAIKGLVYTDIKEAIDFAIVNEITHISYYALEIKPGSLLAAHKAIIDLDLEGDHLEYVKQLMLSHGYERYEVSNWAIKAQYQSIHNKAYWLSRDWKAIGWGAHGFEKHCIYEYDGSLLEWKLKSKQLSTSDLYFQIIMMGLRLVDGLNLVDVKQNQLAYAFYQSKLINCEIIDNHLKVKEIDLLHDTLLNLID